MSSLSTANLTDEDKLEMGLSVAKHYSRLADNELRILIFTATYFVLDGVTLTIRRLTQHLRSRGATVMICSTVPDTISPEQLRDVIVVPGIKIPFADAGEGYAFGGGLDEDTINAIEAYKPNIVHFTVPDLVSLDGIRWCQRNNVAYIGTWHSNYVDYLKYYFLEWVFGHIFHRYIKGFYAQIPTVYVPTRHMLKRMEGWGYNESTELKEWGRGIDLELLSPDRRSNEYRLAKGFSEHDVVVLWVGRIVPEKRPDIWLQAVVKLQQEGFPVKALVVGNGTFEKTLSQVRDVTCCGWLSGIPLAQAYAAADVLLFPSDVETFGNVTLEALASGCPAIVEDKCGGHLVENGVNGFTCPAGDFNAFYLATKRIVENKELRMQMSKAARASAWRYEKSKILQQMAENYKDAIQQFSDPNFIRKRLLSSNEAAGRNFLSIICCNYRLARMIAEPFLNTTQGVQNFVHGSRECLQQSRSRLSCADMTMSEVEEKFSSESERSRFEDERKGRNSNNPCNFVFGGSTSSSSQSTWTTVTNACYYLAIVMAYVIIILFIWFAFTI